MTSEDPRTPHGLKVDPLTDTEVDAVVRAVLTKDPPGRGNAGASTVPLGWFVTELTDGRLTGQHTVDGWRNSHDSHPADTPTPLSANRDDWWRIVALHIFDPAAQITIRGDDGALSGWRLSDSHDVAVLDDWHRHRDRSMLITGPNITEHAGFMRVVAPDFRVWIIPAARGTLARSAGQVVSGTRLHIREYFRSDPGTGAVGVAAHRYRGFHHRRTLPEATK